MPSSAPSQNRSSWRRLTWIGCALPILAFVGLYRAHQLPKELARETIVLTGEWRVSEDGSPGLQDPSVDDSAWRPFILPGGYTLQGFSAERAWFRRTVDLPPSFAGRALLFELGDTRSGIGEVFFNGAWVGSTEPLPRGGKTDLSGSDAWRIPPELVHAGRNVIAIRFHWTYPGQDGIMDSAAYLGPYEALERHYVDAGDLRRFVQHGTAVVLVFLLVCFAVFARVSGEGGHRELYRASVVTTVTALGFLTLSSGLLRVPIGSRLSLPLVYATVLGVSYSIPDWLMLYFLGPTSRGRRIHRMVCAGFGILFAVAAVVLRFRSLTPFYLVLAAYSLVVIALVSVVAVARLVHPRSHAEAIVAVAALISAVPGAFDFLRDFRIVAGPRMFPIGLGFTAVMLGAVLIADVIRTLVLNAQLTTSLQRQNRALASAMDKVMETSRLKADFIATVSHELRTPLNPLLNLPEALLERFLPVRVATCGECRRAFELEGDESLDATTVCPACQATGRMKPGSHWRFQGDLGLVVDSLRRMRRAASSLFQQIRRILDFSLLEAGEDHLHLTPVALQPLLHEVREVLAPLADARGIDVRIEVAEGVTVDADQGKCRRLLLELTENAIKFSHPKGVVVVRAELRADSCSIGVIDQGVGIVERDRRALFDPFRQLDGSETRPTGGIGLGLALARRLTELHGGSIEVNSVPGKGSTFHVLLPNRAVR